VWLDNHALIVPFVPPVDDGDTFIYTELLDRTKRKGNNGHRLVKTYFHRSVEEFMTQLPEMVRVCDHLGVRACTRLAPRSFKKVGKEFARLVIETTLSENWSGMKSLYQRACGTVTPNTKLWLWDIDAITPETVALATEVQRSYPNQYVTTISSKKGMHLITRAFDLSGFRDTLERLEITVHKDNPTNLYIPDNAA